ncbi:MAG TPA: methanol--corrinoid methyltransferase [Clostridiaceae bacterium]|nr:methanol--corrinoid methyltransferase [Clostridiaceae bacterium]
MPKKYFNELAYKSIDDFVYGSSIYPVKCKNGLVIGGGQIYPELNFTLPTMLITQETMPEVLQQYKSIIEDACKRARELYSQGFVVEIELLPPTTYHPEWGIEIIKTVRNVMFDYEQKYGLKSALRVTPVDIREDRESVHMWKGKHWDAILETFEGSAKVGADFLAIESIGGKDIHDDALVYCEITKSLFSLGVLGARDMSKLWSAISDIADRTGSIASGDTACGFSNTAMVLADRGYIPKVFSAVVRVMSAVRSLVAVEEGAVGPHKDCGYEGVYVKAISGIPIAMEGKSSACAHLSSLGNIAAAVADLWSNESVQNIKLLGGMAPTVSMEQLIYDCRLMNQASSRGKEQAILLRDMLADSDSHLDPQAYVLRPDVVLRISQEIVKENDHLNRTKAAALATIEELRKASAEDKVLIEEREQSWLDIMEGQIEAIPQDEEEFIKQMVEENASDKFVPAKYGL